MQKLAMHGGRPVRENFLPFSSPDMDTQEEKALLECIRSGWLTTGPRAQEFESQLCSYTGAGFSLGTNSCTAALHLSLIALGVGKGDEVITTPLTFAATVNVIEHVGATPVLVDIGSESYLIDSAKIESSITEHTRAIIPVHYAGLACDMERIEEIAREHELSIIEDAAHAIGTRYDGYSIGSGKNISCFSFYATKNVAAGEGGAVTSNNPDLMEKIRIACLHGLSSNAWNRYAKSGKTHYDIVTPGFKYNMSDLTAALAIVQLGKLEIALEERQKIADRYYLKLKNIEGIILPEQMHATPVENRCAWHLYPVLLDARMFKDLRDDIVYALRQENIGVSVHYRAIFDQKYYREKYKYNRQIFPNAANVSDNVFTLPLDTTLSVEDQNDVVEALNKVLDHYR